MSLASTVIPWLTAHAPWLIRLLGRIGPKPPGIALIEQLNAYWTSQAISTAVRLGIADALGSGSKDATALARELDLDPTALFRLLRSLAAVGLLRQRSGASFELTARGQLLRSDVPNSLHSLALLTGGVWYRSFAELDRSIKDGQPAFRACYEASFFEHLDAQPELAAHFRRGMQTISALEDPLIAFAFNYSKFSTAVDVGGGTGGLLFAILRAHTRIKGILFDLPATVDAARADVPDALRERVRFVGGDFFTAVPEGGDLYVLKSIVHDWDEESAKTILRNCRAAIPDHGRLLLVEHVIDDDDTPQPGKHIDLLMLSTLGGMERTFQQYADLLAAVGFEVTRQYPTVSPISIIEAKPV